LLVNLRATAEVLPPDAADRAWRTGVGVAAAVYRPAKVVDVI
jgi:hypothetical protein